MDTTIQNLAGRQVALDFLGGSYVGTIVTVTGAWATVELPGGVRVAQPVADLWISTQPKAATPN